MSSREITTKAGGAGTRWKWKQKFAFALHCKATFTGGNRQLTLQPVKSNRSGGIQIEGGAINVKSKDRFRIDLFFLDVPITPNFFWDLEVEYDPGDDQLTFEIDKAELWFLPDNWRSS